MYSQPQQVSHGTQTMPQPSPKPVCVPLLLVDEDGKKRYCYHGGKCRCETCQKMRDQQAEELDEQLLAALPHSRLQLVPALRQVRPKQYRLDARYATPELSKYLSEEHKELRKKYKTYYLPEKYFQVNAFKVPGPQHKQTQTDIRIGSYGIDGCPCIDKSLCWDI
ncbi:uncharacterized protein DMAD_04370 [Drosophila madeirensis]|uniref:Uncharacterized protein n=1 Tax=Drosophila madeirensis TaxID=30013 RepID=A0AAU9GCK4_DROMD